MVTNTYDRVRITNNTFDQGAFSDGATTTTYKYDVHINSTNNDMMIEGNTFFHILSIGDTNSVSNTFIRSVNANTINVHYNRFIRSTSTINSYIAFGSSAGSITDNFFDLSTIDGTNDVLVAGLGSTTLYERNQNQVAYIPIPIAGFANSHDTPGTSTLHADLNASFIGLFVGTTGQKEFTFNIPINASLPENIRILGLKLGIYLINIGATFDSGAGTNEVDFSITSQDIVPANYTAGLNSILDAKNNISLTVQSVSSPYNVFSGLAALTSATQYLLLDTSASVNFITGKNFSLTVVVDALLKITVAGSAELFVSPIVARCVW